MPLSWNEIKSRAIAFGKEWSEETSERAESQSFWNAFFHVFGIERRRVAAFEKQVAMARAGHKLKQGRIDGFSSGGEPLLEAKCFPDVRFIDAAILRHLARRIAGKKAILDDRRRDTGTRENRAAETQLWVYHYGPG